MKPSGGFTLLEVLIALAVLAIAMGAVIGATTQSINTVGTLRDQAVASWVAANQTTLLLAEGGSWPEEGAQEGKVDMANNTWYWVATFSETEDKDLRRVDLSVRKRENGPVLSYRIAFKGQKPEKPAEGEEDTTEEEAETPEETPQEEKPQEEKPPEQKKTPLSPERNKVKL